jgi:hypothetical protein
MSLAGSRFSSDSAPGPSIMGFEDEVEQSVGRPCQTNGRFKRTYELTSSIVPRGTLFHHAVELECSPVGLDTVQLRHAATASRVQRNSVPSTQMRCKITASRRARATTAFFMPRCLAICIAQALSQDHLVERNSMPRCCGVLLYHQAVPSHQIRNQKHMKSQNVLQMVGAVGIEPTSSPVRRERSGHGLWTRR